MQVKTSVLISILVLAVTVPAGATVLTGAITHLPESTGLFTWGDGANDLYQQWSVQNVNSSGWFYGSTYAWSNADVYTYAGLTDPTTVFDATIFPYSSSAVSAQEGDTVFFRGTNGYYGAWRIDNIYPSDGSFPYAFLDGQWYFQDNGSGNFGGTTAIESKSWGGVKSLYR